MAPRVNKKTTPTDRVRSDLKRRSNFDVSKSGQYMERSRSSKSSPLTRGGSRALLDRVKTEFTDHGLSGYTPAIDYEWVLEGSPSVGYYTLRSKEKSDFVEVTSENIIYVWDGTTHVPGVLDHDGTGRIVFRDLNGTEMNLNPSVTMFGVDPTLPKKSTFFYGNVLFEDFHDLVDEIGDRNSQLYALLNGIDDGNRYNFSAMMHVRDLNLSMQTRVFNDSVDEQGSSVHQTVTIPFFDRAECESYLKSQFLDGMFTMVYNYSKQRDQHPTRAKGIAFSIRHYMDISYENFREIYPPKDEYELDKVLLSEGVSLSSVIDTYINLLNRGSTNAEIQSMLEFYTIIQTGLNQMFANLAQQFVLQINRQLGTWAPQIDLFTGVEDFPRPALVTVQNRNLDTMDTKTNYENKLAMILEPRHDFKAERGKGENVRKTVDRVTNNYIDSHKRKNVVDTGGEFERRNFIEYSSTFDDTRLLQCFSYEKKKITNETAKGEFYTAIRWLVESFILGRPLVRDANGTIFLKKLFGIKKESKSAEITIDGASGSGMKIESNGQILVDYANDIFKLPTITPSLQSPILVTGSDAVKKIKTIGKLQFGIKRKEKGKGVVIANEWTPGIEYKVNDVVFLNVRGEDYDLISVPNLSRSIKTIEGDKSLTPWERDIAVWSCLNMKRAGDQGQALFAREIGGVFETLDFLAAAFASVKGIDYMVNSDKMRSLFVKVQREMNYQDFKEQTIRTAVRLGQQSQYQQLATIVPNIIAFAEKNIPQDEPRMDFLSLLMEMVGVGVTLKASLDEAYKGKLKGYIKNFFEELIQKLSVSNLDMPVDKVVDRLESATDAQLLTLFKGQALASFCKTNFAVFSRFNGAMVYLKNGFERLMQSNVGVDQETMEEFFTICSSPIAQFIDEIFPGVGNIVDRLSYARDVLMGLIANMRDRLLFANVDPEKMIYAEEFFDFFKLYLETFFQRGRVMMNLVTSQDQSSSEQQNAVALNRNWDAFTRQSDSKEESLRNLRAMYEEGYSVPVLQTGDVPVDILQHFTIMSESNRVEYFMSLDRSLQEFFTQRIYGNDLLNTADSPDIMKEVESAIMQSPPLTHDVYAWIPPSFDRIFDPNMENGKYMSFRRTLICSAVHEDWIATPKNVVLLVEIPAGSPILGVPLEGNPGRRFLLPERTIFVLKNRIQTAQRVILHVKLVGIFNPDQSDWERRSNQDLFFGNASESTIYIHPEHQY